MLNIHDQEEVNREVENIVDEVMENNLISLDFKWIDFEFSLKELIPDKVETFCERLDRERGESIILLARDKGKSSSYGLILDKYLK